MRIAIMAAGAVGAYYGARLAVKGHDVFFIARGAHLDAIKKNGLKIESVHGDLHLPKPNVTDDPRTIGPVDVVIFAVKLWDTEQAAEQTKPLIGPNTRVITLQNGIDSVDRVGGILGRDKVVGGYAYIASTISGPGVIKHTSQFHQFRFGFADNRPDATLDAFVAAGKDAGLDLGLSTHIERELWEKFIFLTAMTGATAALRSGIGPILADPDTKAFFRQLMQEALAVGKAKGVTLDPAYIDERMTFVETKTVPTMKGSMANDLDRGGRLELDWLSGKVRALGREFGIATPASETVYIVLKLHRMGTQH
ncbi:ketopantoate reductase family protein [Pseudolabrys taiwanensis]|uniref:2-dehydropantoate 2-reductase n=1 Tax=Pseudolabrys taiwanensis TaxID=331696 RepID=A0A346A233_9HYPH|nr:ketopantoate reductase family protein [Pseudolabrys taiwanensis]AXK83230.1 ketopantoate reductase family protein [Pseudolabrys taiwanensis]